MSFISTEGQRALLPSFRDFARDIRKEKPYKFIVSECKGSLNIIIGLGQILVCPCFKLFNAERMYEVHIEAGKTALKQGFHDLIPSIVLIGVIALAVKSQQWMSNYKESNNFQPQTLDYKANF